MLFFFFSFSTLPSENKVFLCAVQMVPSCGLTVYFRHLFFFKEKNPRRGNKQTKTNNKTKHRRLTLYLEEHLN